MKTIKIYSLILLSLIILLSSQLNAQEPPTLWIQSIGGDSDDVSYDVEELWDGGFAVIGYSNSYSTTGFDVWLLRTDANGDTLWTKRYGGIGDDYGYSLKKTDDGGFIIGGATSSFGNGGLDFYMIRADSAGRMMWSKTFGGVNDDICWSVENTDDGGFVMTGMTKSGQALEEDVWIIKTDQSGTVIWEKIYGSINDDVGFSVKKTLDNGYIVAGSTGCTIGAGNALCDGWVIKTDANGDSLWTKVYKGTQSDWFSSVASTTEEGYILTGRFIPLIVNEFSDVWLVKTDSLGNELWSKNYDYDNNSDFGYSVQQTLDGGYIICGSARPFDGSQGLWIIKADSSGNLLWDKFFPFIGDVIFNNPTPFSDGGLSVKQTEDLGYIISGYKSVQTGIESHHQVYLIRIAPDIVPVELISFTAEVNNNTVTLNWQTVTETNNSGFEVQRSQNSKFKIQNDWEAIGFVAGHGTTTETQSYLFEDKNLFADVYQYRLKQIDFDGSFEYSNTIEVEINSPSEFSLEQNYPNPFNPTTSIQYAIGIRQFVTIKIFDVLGNEVATLVNEEKSAGSYEVKFNSVETLHATSLPSGIYFYQLKVGDFLETRKMILLR